MNSRIVVLFAAVAFAAVGCGGPLAEARMCQKLEGGECPEGLEMFVRTAKRLYLSGHPNVGAGAGIEVDVLYLPEPETPESVYNTVFEVPEGDGPVAIPLEPGRLKVGSYRLVAGEAGAEPALAMEFSVWNTQAEIDALRELGDKRGAILTSIRVCKEAVDNECEESFESMPHGQKQFHLTFHYDDVIDGTEVSIEWLRNGKRIHFQKNPADSSSGRMWAMIGLKNSPMARGKYEARITASKSKQGMLRKTWVVK